MELKSRLKLKIKNLQYNENVTNKNVVIIDNFSLWDSVRDQKRFSHLDGSTISSKVLLIEY